MSEELNDWQAQSLARRPQQLAPTLARFDLRVDRGARTRRRRDREVGRTPYMAQILIKAERRPSWGDPHVRPRLEGRDQARHHRELPSSRSHYEELPMPPVGSPVTTTTSSPLTRYWRPTQVMSLTFDGTFDRHPNLRIVFVEHAFSWTCR